MPRVLIVEDEPLIREIAVDEFTDAGWEVGAVASGDEALVHLERGETFDLVFTDIRMPGALDGWELGRLAGNLYPAIKVIYATGFSETTRPLTCNERFISKPYRSAEILRLVEDLGLAE
jgi:CheY-like chemotaxis protein